jgi:hypothetical protein
VQIEISTSDKMKCQLKTTEIVQVTLIDCLLLQYYSESLSYHIYRYEVYRQQRLPGNDCPGNVTQPGNVIVEVYIEVTVDVQYSNLTCSYLSRRRFRMPSKVVA